MMYNNEVRNMKRGHSPDFEINARGMFRGHPNQYFNKRHRGDNYRPPQTIEEKITNLGDVGSRDNDIGNLAKEIDVDLASKVGEDEKIKTITSTICKCIISYPTRIASYATLIGLISVKHYNVSCQIINSLHASYPVYLEAQKWQEAIIIIHLLSSLVNCKVIRPSALISQFELLLEIAQEDNIPQARSDYYVYTVLSSLPFVALELSNQTEPNNFEQILSSIESYLTKRSKDHLNVTRVWLSNDSTVQMDYLDSLWVQTKNFRANGWLETYLHRPYNDKEYIDIMTSSLITQNSPTIQIPAHSSNYVYPSPRIVLRLFEDDVTEGHRQIPGSDKIERFCIENHIRNIIDEISKEPQVCMRHLNFMHFANRLPMKHLLVETILGELFTLPQPKHNEILYHTLLFEFIKIYGQPKNPDDVKFNDADVVINEAVKVLYENLDTMNITCLDRLIDWFSFHLNNTEFIYPWQNWADATEKDVTSPKAMFVRNILDRCVRLSFHQKISILVSSNLASLMPPEVSIEYKPVNSDNPKAAELHETVKKLIVEKADGKLISQTLNITIDGVELPEDFSLAEEKHSEKLLKIDVFTAVILKLASKSLTHLSSAIGKFRNVFKALTRVEQGQHQLLNTMHSCLENHPQVQIILIDKLLKAELIEAKEVCSWIFSESMKPHYLKSYPWELLHNIIQHTSRAIGKMLAQKEAPAKVEIKTETGEGDDTEENKDVEMKPEVDVELDEKIEKAQTTYHELIIQVFEKFATILGEHIREKELANTSYMDESFRYLTGRMQQVYYNHYKSTQGLYDEIKAIIDRTPSIGNSVMNLSQ